VHMSASYLCNVWHGHDVLERRPAQGALAVAAPLQRSRACFVEEMVAHPFPALTDRWRTMERDKTTFKIDVRTL